MSARAANRPLQILPRGRHAAPREIVAGSQRDRLLIGLADAVAEKGYAHIAVADILEHARVSRRTFYELFANKEECFLAAYDAGVDGLLAVMAEEEEAAGSDALARARAGTEAYLQLLADNPAFARTFLIEVLGAGPAALARRAAVHERFAERLADSYGRAGAQSGLPSPLPTLPGYVFRAAVGAIHELVIACLLEQGAEELPSLLDEILEIELRLLMPRTAGAGS